MIFMALLSRGGPESTPAHDPLARKVIQALAAVFPDHQGLAELQPHLFVFRDDVGLDGDDHVLAEDDLRALVPARAPGLKDRRVLVGAVNQVVVDAVAAPVDDLRSPLLMAPR